MQRNMADITGWRFGRLVAMEPTDLRRGGSVVWRCACDCGGEKFATSKALKVGYAKSCGCLNPRNKFYEIDGTGFCLMSNGEYFWFSLDDADFITGRQWVCDSDGYAVTWKDGNNKRLIRMLFGLQKGDMTCIDHINGDVRDNRRCNLRTCTTAQNVRHTSKEIKGYYRQSNGKYQARIKADGKFHYLGVYNTAEEARAVYLTARDEIQGAFHAHEKIVWYPGCTADSWLPFTVLLDWVNFLTDFVPDAGLSKTA